MSASRRHRRDRGRRGIALIVVLWLLVILALLTVSLATDARTEMLISTRTTDELRVRAICDSAVERAIAQIRAEELQEIPSFELLSAWRDDEDAFRGVPLDHGRFWVVFGEADPGDGREVRWGARDETGRLDINVASRDQLLALELLDEEIVDAIIDWRDGDDEISENGAEVDYYGTLDPPYRPKNGPIESLEELLLVRDLTEAVLWGEDRNRNGLLDPSEDDGDQSFPPDDGDGELDRGLADFITLFTRTPDVNAAGEARLDANGGDQNEIETRLTDAGLDGAALEAVLDRLDGGQPITSIGELAILPEVDETAFAIIHDELTVRGGGQMLPGLINVNTAPRQVIAGIPVAGEGEPLDDSEIDAILSGRASGDGSLESPAWLLRVLPPERLAEIIDSVTTRSWQFMIHAVARLDDRPVMRRVEVLVDRSYQPYRVYYERDITSLGFPLPEAVAEGEEVR